MSMYLQIDNEEPADLSSNKGWADFVRWGESLDSDKFPELSHFCENSWSDDPAKLEQEIKAAIEEDHPNVFGVADIAKNLMSLANGAEVINLSDGIVAE